VQVTAAKGKRARGITILRGSRSAGLGKFVYGFSTREGGVSTAYGTGELNLGFTKHDSRAAVERNRAAFLRAVGATSGKKVWPLVNLRQIHSDIIHCVARVPEEKLAGDGLITATPGLMLGVLTADCVPILIFDRKVGAVGVFHAGWRGTLRRIVEKGVGEMRKHLGSRAGDLRAMIGPGIGACCYEIGEEVRGQFVSQFEYGAELFREVKESDAVRERYPLLFLTARPPGHSELPVHLFLNLMEANRRQLQAAGIPRKNIQALELCTACHTDQLFSHRRENGRTGRMMGVAGIRP
jgi:polyphenol oxidase